MLYQSPPLYFYQKDMVQFGNLRCFEVASIHHDEQFRTGLEQLVSPLVNLAD